MPCDIRPRQGVSHIYAWPAIKMGGEPGYPLCFGVKPACDEYESMLVDHFARWIFQRSFKIDSRSGRTDTFGRFLAFDRFLQRRFQIVESFTAGCWPNLVPMHMESFPTASCYYLQGYVVGTNRKRLQSY